MFLQGSDDEECPMDSSESVESDTSQVQMAQTSSQASRRSLLLVVPGPPPLDPEEPVETTSSLRVIPGSSDEPRRYNQYTVVKRVGTPNNSTVYECFDELKGLKVVVKRLQRPAEPPPARGPALDEEGNPIKGLRRQGETRKENVRKEIAIMKPLRHANAVRLIEIIDDPGHKDKHVYLVMELLEGGPIQWHREKSPILTLIQIRRIMRDTILGLEYLHHEGIIHRDIKPDNLVWTRDRQYVKLIDFGVAHYIPPAKHGKGKQAESDNAISDNAIDPDLFPESDLRKTFGTPAFLAPEVVWADDEEEASKNQAASNSTSFRSLGEGSGKKKATPQERVDDRPPITKSIDIWALGVTFYCFLFGKTPFDPAVDKNAHWTRQMVVLHELIRTQEWPLENLMSVDDVPTGGRPPARRPKSDGDHVVWLLNRLLQKKAENRITLPELKANPWILKDVAEPKKWLRQTSPSEDETDSKESKVLNIFNSARTTIRNKLMSNKDLALGSG